MESKKIKLCMGFLCVLVLMSCKKEVEGEVEIPFLDLNLLEGAYVGTGVTGGTEEKVDLLRLKASQTVTSTHIPNVDGFDLRQGAAEIVLVFSETVALAVRPTATTPATPVSPATLTNLHESIGETDKVFLVLRDYEGAQGVTGLTGFFDTRENIQVQIADVPNDSTKRNTITLSVYSQYADITYEDNTVFVLVQDTTQLPHLRLNKVLDSADAAYVYQAMTPVTGASATAIDVVKVEEAQIVAASDIVNVDAFDLSGIPTDGTLTLNEDFITAIAGDTSTHISPTALTNLHPNIDTIDKVFLVLRDDSNPRAQAVDGLVDTDVDVLVQMNNASNEKETIALGVHSQNADITNGDNTVFVLLQKTDVLATYVPFMNVGDYRVGTDVTAGTEDQVEVVNFDGSTGTALASELQNVDGFDLRGASSAVNLSLNTDFITAVMPGVVTDPPTVVSPEALTSWQADIGVDDKVFLILRDEHNQNVEITGLVDTNLDVKSRIGDLDLLEEATFSVHSQNADITNGDNRVFVLVQAVIVSVVNVGDYTVGTSVAAGTENKIEVVNFDGSTGPALAVELQNVDGFDLRGTRLSLNTDFIAALAPGVATDPPIVVSPAKLTNLHANIGGDDKVFLILRDNANQTVTLGNLVDTTENVTIRMHVRTLISNGVPSDTTFSVYSQNIDITNSGNSVFILLQD